MTLSEPMTLVTDVLLGTLCEVCAVLLLKHNVPLRQASIRLWALALMAVAIGSYAGVRSTASSTR